MGKKYAGNPWLNSYTILLSVITTIYFATFWKNASEHPILFGVGIIAIIAISYLSKSLQMNYFIIEDKTLIIKNHFNTDEITTIPMKEISGIEIGTIPRGPKALKVIMADNKKRIFQASSLSKKNWNEFKKEMLVEGFTIIDNGIVFYNEDISSF